jgi:SAM-dependent methyltransferase
MTEAQFDLERSRAYWRHLPSGSGKHDTSVLVGMGDRDLLATWDKAFRSRFANYPEEEQFLRTFGERVHGRRLLSIGSGLGFHEMYYASRGADVTCLDIVQSNIDVLTRLAHLKRLPSLRARFCEDASAAALGGPFDIVLIYGCLMHMPSPAQRALLAAARAALNADGSVVLMVYAWEFVQRTCGWTDPADFDPLMFGRASDPSVGADACPWSDWHDDRKLLELAGSGMHIKRRQSWNDALFTWYELAAGSSFDPPLGFFPPSALEAGSTVASVSPGTFEAADAQVSREGDRVAVKTGVNHYSYAAMSATLATAPGANAISAEIDLERGGVSLGLLDLDRQQFVATTTLTAPGRRSVLLLVPSWPNRAKIVFSNHQRDSPQGSVFEIHRVSVLKRPVAEPPPTQTA